MSEPREFKWGADRWWRKQPEGTPEGYRWTRFGKPGLKAKKVKPRRALPKKPWWKKDAVVITWSILGPIVLWGIGILVIKGTSL